jgi:hypothetical protein
MSAVHHQIIAGISATKRKSSSSACDEQSLPRLSLEAKCGRQSIDMKLAMTSRASLNMASKIMREQRPVDIEAGISGAEIS